MDVIISIIGSSWPYLIAIAVMCGILSVIRTVKPKKTTSAKIKYKKKDLVTPRELKFYKELKPICDRNRLTLFTKVRLSDILEPNAQSKTSEYNAGFSRITSKHIDFVLCDNVQLAPLVVIELDDSTHQRSDRQKRDAFVDEAMKSANIPIIHTYDANKLEEKNKSGIRPKIKDVNSQIIYIYIVCKACFFTKSCI